MVFVSVRRFARRPTALLALLLAAVTLFAGACGGGGAPGATKAPATPQETAERFLSAWKDKRYSDMYDLLTTEAMGTIDRQKFIDRYGAIADEAMITGIDYELKPLASGGTADVSFSITFHTAFLGDIKQDNTVPLIREAVPQPAPTGEKPGTTNEWRIKWTPSLIFTQLDDRSLVHFFPRVPRRGTIFDRNGKPLALDADLSVVGIVPNMITDKEAVIAALSQALQMPAGDVRAKVETTLPSYYFIPVKVLPYGTPPEEVQKFRDMVNTGVVVQDQVQRVYPYGSSLAHVLGYMTEVTQDQLKDLASKGFAPGDKIGAAGLEGDQNDVLSGQRGGLLATILPEGSIAKTIAEKPSTAGEDIYLSIDIAVQQKAEAELGERVGSIVVMDPRDNGVLALASFPRFDPNAFIRGLTTDEFNALQNDPRQPFLNRPLLAQYPPGSTFKVVTATAGLEKGGFTTDSTFHCVPVWTGLGAQYPQDNWQTVDRGYLTVSEGLMASCNPVFFEIAKALDEKDPNILPSITKAFGYGSITGIGLEEATGTVPGPQWKQDTKHEAWYTGDATNMAIGQGGMLATPMQIANVYSAIAGPGILRKPLLIKKIAQPGGAAVQEMQTQVINPLPASPGTLDAVRYGLYLVTQSPSGTSYAAWTGSTVDAAGKSGTAEDISFGANHVFFVAYANRGAPSIVALAALETGQSGSREAAPMVRAILEAYLGGQLGTPP